MNSLIETLNLWGARLPDFAWPMLWQSSVLISVLFVFDIAARRKVRASVRYAVWLVVLVKLLLPPTLALPTSVAWWVRPTQPPPKAQLHTTAFVVTYGDLVPANFPTSAPRVSLPPPKPSLSGAGRTAATWAAVGACLLVWLVVRWRKVAGDVRKATVAPEALGEMLDGARLCIKLPRHVRLMVTKRAMSPAVCGLFRPVILLPQSLVEHLQPAQLRAVLLHELVHLRRGDVWVNCVQSLLQIFYWWHPLLWLANARIRRVREEAVDDAVMLALREDAETYAPTLLAVAKLAFNRPLASLGLLGILESRSALGQRIERLVDFRPPRKAGLTIASALCVLAFAAQAVPMEKAPTREKANSTKEQSDSSGTGPAIQISSNSADAKTNVTELVQRGRSLLEAGRLGEAEAELKLAVGTEPDNRLALYYLRLINETRLTKAERPAAERTPVLGDVPLVGRLFRSESTSTPNAIAGEVLVTRTLKFDPEVFLPNLRERMHLPEKSTDAEAIQALPGYLIEAGLDFSPSYASFLKERGLALFHAPQQKIEAIERLFTELNGGRPQSEIPDPGRPPDREAIMRKLDQIRFDSPAYNETPLIEVIRDLSWETKHHDPEGKGFGFHIKYSAKPGKMVDLSAVKVTAPPIFYARPSDVLEAIIKGADQPINYYIWAGVVFYSTVDEAAFPTGTTGGNVLPYINVSEPNDAIEPSLARMTNRVPVLGDIPLVGKLFRSDIALATNGSFGDAVPKSLYESRPGPRIGTDLYLQVELRGDGSYWAGGKRMNLEELRDWLAKTTQSGSNTSIGFQVHSNAPPETVRALTDLRKKFGVGVRPVSLPVSSPEQLSIRAFKVDSNALCKALENASPPPVNGTNISVAAQTFFSSLGVDFGSTVAMALGKTFFWSDGSGLLVRATKQDLDVIETALEALIRPLPQINIKVRFVEIERGDPRATGWDWFRGNDLLAKGSGTNSSSHCYILTDPQFRVVLRAFEQRKGADTLAGPEISTVSGRQAQVQVVEMKTVLTGINPQALLPPGIISTTGTSNALYQTQAMSFGPVLDVIPALAADGNTISLTITPTVTEFLGYDDPTTNTAVYINGKKETVAVPLPRFRVRQMNLSAAVQDGQTLVLLNPATTEIFKKPDGGTETKDVSSTQTNQLIVFLTATLVDAAGNRLHAAEESAPKPK